MKHYKCMVNLNTVDGSEIRRSPVDIANRPVICKSFIHVRWLFVLFETRTSMGEICWGTKKKDPKKDTLLGTNIYPFYSRHFWADDFPNFPRWDMWSFPGDYLVNLLLKGPALTWFHPRNPTPPKANSLSPENGWQREATITFHFWDHFGLFFRGKLAP